MSEDTALDEKWLQIERMETAGSIVRGCEFCQREFYAADSPAYVFAPRHRASGGCRSGGHPHCTCDTCF